MWPRAACLRSGVLAQAKRPMVIVGSAAAGASRWRRPCWLWPPASPLAASAGKEPGWNAFNVLHTAASRVAGLDLGFVPGKGGSDIAGMLKSGLDVVYLLGADEIDMRRLGQAFVIYQGSHGDAGAHRADVILPGAAYTEKSRDLRQSRGTRPDDGQGRLPAGRGEGGLDDPARAVGSARAHAALRHARGAARRDVSRARPRSRRSMRWRRPRRGGGRRARQAAAQVSAEPFGAAITDFYLTNPIARASAVMAELSALKASQTPRRTAAE